MEVASLVFTNHRKEPPRGGSTEVEVVIVDNEVDAVPQSVEAALEKCGQCLGVVG